jgi:hypothetical protein
MERMSDVEVFQLKKDNHVITFEVEENAWINGRNYVTMKVGQARVRFGEYSTIHATWPLGQARNLWKTKVKEGYKVFE